ncbi:MAG: electron transfer flavoprotein subunit alpha/FixB family protein, partial [Ferrovibrio sp.]|nr:electron transfer flavoprotein subunit alpha/FixB family protein [Ferrovibrio sp.]
MSVLVIAEHDNASLKGATLNAVTAAKAIDADVHVLVAGENAGAAAAAAAKVAGVAKVIHVDAAQYGHGLAEALGVLIAGLGKGYGAIVAPETTSGKNVMPRVAALLDVMQISGIVEVKSADTFVRPIYAGNAMATVQSSDAIKVITVRTTGFAAAAAEGGSAAVETAPAASDPGLS